MPALAELSRVLKPGGFCVLQTPYSALLEETFCDPAINTDDLRRRFYGEETHVRIYGRDLFKRIQQHGLKLSIRSHAATMPDMDALVYGINPAEDLILATKD